MEPTYYDPEIIEQKIHRQYLRITEIYMECGTCAYEPPESIVPDRRGRSLKRLEVWKMVKCPKCGCYTIVPLVRLRMILAMKWAESLTGKRSNGYHIGRYTTKTKKG